MMPSSHQKFGCDDARQDDQQIKHRQPDQISIKRWREIGQAAVIALDGAGGDADDRADHRQRQAEQNRDAKAVNQPRQHIAALIVGAEPIDRAGGEGAGEGRS